MDSDSIFLRIFLLGILTSIAVIFFFVRQVSWFVSLPDQYRFVELDSVRGVLAVMVMIHHFIVNYYWQSSGVWGTPSVFVENLGRVSISVFFMITGFLFFQRILSQKIDWRRFYIARFFRLYPVFLFALSVIIVQSYLHATSPYVDAYDFAYSFMRWMVFSVGDDRGDFFGYDHSSLVISGVQWTLRYELAFYLALPIIYLLLRGSVRFFLILTLLVVCLSFLHIEMFGFYFRYIVLFFLGGAVSFLPGFVSRGAFDKFFWNGCLVVAFSISMFLNAHMSSQWIIQSLFLFIVFYILVNEVSVFGFLRIYPLRVLGEVSYSIYLLHGIVIFTLFSLLDGMPFNSLYSYAPMMLIVSVLVVGVSLVVHKYIEKPGILLGKKIA